MIRHGTAGLTASIVERFIRDFVLKHGYSPSVREIGRGVGVSSTNSVRYWLDILERDGVIQRGRRGRMSCRPARSIVLIGRSA